MFSLHVLIVVKYIIRKHENLNMPILTEIDVDQLRLILCLLVYQVN